MHLAKKKSESTPYIFPVEKNIQKYIFLVKFWNKNKLYFRTTHSLFNVLKYNTKNTLPFSIIYLHHIQFINLIKQQNTYSYFLNICHVLRASANTMEYVLYEMSYYYYYYYHSCSQNYSTPPRWKRMNNKYKKNTLHSIKLIL